MTSSFFVNRTATKTAAQSGEFDEIQAADQFFASLVGSPRRRARRPPSLRVGSSSAASIVMKWGPDRVFDEIVHRASARQDYFLRELGEYFGEAAFKIVAAPSTTVSVANLRRGDVVIRRGLGEGRLARMGVLGLDVDFDTLNGPDGRLRSDTLILRSGGMPADVPAQQVDGDEPVPATAWQDLVDASSQQPPVPAEDTDLCVRDVAITEDMALLVTNHAPLPVTVAETKRIAGNVEARDDYKSVCAIVPANPETRLLLFFHGNDNYVTLAPQGDVPPAKDASRHSRVPRWADRTARAGALGKPAAALKYGMGLLSAAQAGLAGIAALATAPVKNPVVLIPEDGERTDGDFWSVPPRGQYGTASDGTPAGPGTTRLQDLVMECYEHLRCLSNPAGRKYLSPSGSDRASWLSNVHRIYLSGHSGGGKPLVECAGADMALVSSTSVMGVGGRAADVWLLDCTYGSFGIQNYVNFCLNWHNAGLLGHRAEASRLVCVYRPRDKRSDTETAADTLRAALAKLLGVKVGSLLKLHDHTDMASPSMVRDVVPALLSEPVVFVRTNVAHDSIPTLFVPLLLRTAAS